MKKTLLTSVGIIALAIGINKYTNKRSEQAFKEGFNEACEWYDSVDRKISKDLWTELYPKLSFADMLSVGERLGMYYRSGLSKGFSDGFTSTVS